MTNVDAMVLCAGLGTRLRPLTLERAKPAVPLLARPLVGWSFERLREAGFESVVVNTHWLPETMEKVAQESARALGMQVRVSHEPDVLGTGGGLGRVRERGLSRADKHLFVMNGDVFFDFDAKSVLESHVESGALATMVMRPLPEGATYGGVFADASGRVVRIRDYGKVRPGLAPLLFTGVHVLSPKALAMLPEGASDVVDAVYGPLVRAGAEVRVVVETGRWLDLGDPEGYLGAHLALAPEGFVDASARVSASASLVRTTVGAGARVGEGARLVDCVVWDGAEVEAGEELIRTVATPVRRVQVPTPA